MEGIIKKIRNIDKYGWIFLLILLFGIVFRTYNFSDWLRFNFDQGRDALLIQELEDSNKLPVLGPMAGGTDFKLGPAFYYFQLASAKIFGMEPEKLAYPDLFFSILSIILFYLLARKLFDKKISLALVWLFAISYFSIKYSRFAWNPNSTPFFSMLFLYSIYNLAISKEKSKFFWALLAGLALGILIQLHTSLLIILPVFSVGVFIWFLKNRWIKKYILPLFLLAAFLVNAPQIVEEINTKGVNVGQFIYGAKQKNSRNNNLWKNALLNLTCQIESNNHILTGLGGESECNYEHEWKTFKKLNGVRMKQQEKASFVFLLVLSLIFSLGGYFLLLKSAANEQEEKRKILLKILSGYFVLSFLFYFTWATELSMRFYLPLYFIPFLILGFWLNLLSEKNKFKILVIISVIAILSFLNFQKISRVYNNLKNGGTIENDFNYVVLGELKCIVNFIQENSGEVKQVFVDGKGDYFQKSMLPFKFLTKGENLEIVRLKKDSEINSESVIFYFKDFEKKCAMPEKLEDEFKMKNCGNCGQFSIFAIKLKDINK